MKLTMQQHQNLGSAQAGSRKLRAAFSGSNVNVQRATRVNSVQRQKLVCNAIAEAQLSAAELRGKATPLSVCSPARYFAFLDIPSDKQGGRYA